MKIMSTSSSVVKAAVLAAMVGAPGCAADGPCDPDEPGTVCTIAGNGERGFDGAQVPALEARMDQPHDMEIAPNGELWIIDFNNYLIRAIDDEGMIRTIVGIGLLGDSPPEGEEKWPAKESAFNHVCDMTFHDDGYLYLAAWHNSRLKRLNLETMMLENYGGTAERTKYYGDGGPAKEAAMDLPSSVAFHPETGNLIFMDQGNQVIREINQDGIISTWAGNCIVEWEGTCDEPVACPDSDKMVCGSTDNCVRQCSPGYKSGHRTEMRLAQPSGQAADPTGRLDFAPDGSLVFADTSNHMIRKIRPDGMSEVVAGTGESGYSGDGGPGSEAQLSHPVDVEVASDGTIYFTDVFNNCVRAVDTSGEIYTVAGQCSSDPMDRGFAGDGGPPTEAKFNKPYGIALSKDEEKLYIADTFNHRVRVVNF